MGQRVSAGNISDVPEGEGVELVLEGRIIALYRVNGQFYAMDGICPHSGGPLGKGELNGSIVTCPWHGWQFDVCEGQHCLTPHIHQTTYDVEIADKEIFVIIPES